MTDVLEYPVRKVWISKGYSGHGYNAIDLGWWDYDPAMPDDTGEHPYLYAMADGIVLSVDNSHSDTPDYATYGNSIAIYYPRQNKTSFYAHIKRDSFLVKPGDTVKQRQPVARMNNSGNSYGSHDHVELCQGRGFVSHGGLPLLDYIYATPWHIVDPDTERDYKILHIAIEPDGVLITKEQVHVTEDGCLRVRSAPTTESEIVGMALQGYYTVEEKQEAGGYTWAKVQGYWIATPTDVSELIPASFYPAGEIKEVDQVEVTIDNLRIRQEPSTASAILGWCPEGFYTVEGVESDEDYVWIKTCGAWIACVDGVIWHAAQDDKDAEIKRLKAEIVILQEEINVRDERIGSLSEQVAQMQGDLQVIAHTSGKYA